MAQTRSFREFEGSDEAVLAELGARLARERLDRNLTQEELAREAGLSRSTVRRLEAGASTQLSALIRVLRVLSLLDNLASLLPDAAVSPLQALDRRGKVRKRASSRARRAKRQQRPWQWGEDK